jgi:hypothetical protein
MHGRYPNMPATRQFDIVFVDATHGAGLAETSAVDRSVTYTGTAVTVTAR